MSDSGRAVFLSYASQDAEAALRMAEALRRGGVEVWLDQEGGLVGGDAWDRKIRGQIASCALFVPMISANTQARLEGYFRLEWKLAAQRTHTMADAKPFLLPVVIDATGDAAAHVPDEFRAVQWTRLSGGQTSPGFVARVRALLSPSGRDGSPSRPPNRSIDREEADASERRPYPRPPESERSRPPSDWRGRKWALIAGALAVLGGAAYLSLQPVRKESPGATKPSPPTPAAQPLPDFADAKSVAVLAFANLSDDKANEYFSDGISEELLNVLAKVPGLKVSARTSAFHFKGKDTPIPEIAQQLGVAYVVEGSVRKAGSQVRITAQLIKAADGFHVWSDTFTRELKDVFAVQDEIAGLIAKNLSLKLGQAGRVNQTINPDAHRLLLEGRHYWNLRTADDLARAEVAFSAALNLDPALADARAGLADVFVVRGWYRLYNGEAGFEADFGRAKAEAQAAIRLDGTLAEPVAALAAVLMNEGDLTEAERHFRRALALNPNHATGRFWFSILHLARGELELALAEVEHAVRLDPLSFIILDDYARDLAYARRLQEADDVGNRAQSLRREYFVPNHAQRAMVLLQLGRADAAAAAARGGAPVDRDSAVVVG